MTKSLKQTMGSINCYAVCVAMALDKTVEEVENEMGHPPYSDIDVYRYMINQGYVLGLVFETNTIVTSLNLNFKFHMTDNPCFIIVKSETKPAPTTHAIYWDGVGIYDPNPNSENNRHISSYQVELIIPINKIIND